MFISQLILRTWCNMLISRLEVFRLPMQVFIRKAKLRKTIFTFDKVYQRFG